MNPNTFDFVYSTIKIIHYFPPFNTYSSCFSIQIVSIVCFSKPPDIGLKVTKTSTKQDLGTLSPLRSEKGLESPLRTNQVRSIPLRYGNSSLSKTIPVSCCLKTVYSILPFSQPIEDSDKISKNKSYLSTLLRENTEKSS